MKSKLARQLQSKPGSHRLSTYGRSNRRRAETDQPSSGMQPALELTPPVATEDSPRWCMLGDEALQTPLQRRKKPKPDIDYERWLKALSRAA